MEKLKLSCQIHPEQKIEWFCLELDCPQRLLCSKCAIQSHKKEHKVEELSNLQNCNLQTFLKSDASQRYSLINPERYQSELQEISNQVSGFLKCCGDLYSAHYQQSVIEEVDPNYKELNKDIQQQMKWLSQNIGGQAINQEQLKSKLDQQLKQVNELIFPKNIQQDSFSNQKKSLYSRINISFLNWLKAFYLSPFMDTCIECYKLQLQTLKDLNGKEDFFNFIENKWLTDYQVIQTNIECDIEQLKNNLNSIMYQPNQFFKNQNKANNINNELDNYQRIQLDKQLCKQQTESKNNSPQKQRQLEWPNYPEQSMAMQQQHKQVYQQQQIYEPKRQPEMIETYQPIQQSMQQMVQLPQPMLQIIQEPHPDHFQVNQLKSVMNPLYIGQEKPSPQRFIIQEKEHFSKERILQKPPQMVSQIPQINQWQISSLQQPLFATQGIQEKKKHDKGKLKQDKNHKNKHQHEEYQEGIPQFQYKSVQMNGPFIPNINAPGPIMQQNPFPNNFKPSPLKQVSRQNKRPF